MSKRKIGVILAYLLMILEAASAIFVTPIVLSSLGQNNYGIYKLVVSINAYLMLFDLGVGNAVVRFVAKYRFDNDIESGRKFMGVVSIFYGIISLLAIITGFTITIIFPFAFSKGLSNSEILLSQQLLFFTTITSAITLGTSGFSNAIVAFEKFGVSKIPSIIEIIIRTALIVLSLKLGFGSVGLVVVNLVTTFVCRLFYVLYTVFVLKYYPVFKKIQSPFVKEIFLYSGLITLQMLATQINQSVDQVLIGSMVSNSSRLLGIYGVSTQITQYFMTIGSAITGILMPGIVGFVRTNKDSVEIQKEMTRISKIVSFPLFAIFAGFVVFGKEFIILWAGNEYSNSYIIAIILMAPQLIILSQSVGTQLLWAVNKHKMVSYIKIGIVIVNIGLTALLIQINPLIGAAIGTFVSLLIGDIVLNWFIFKKELGIKPVNYILNSFIVQLMCCLLLVPLFLGVDSFLHNFKYNIVMFVVKLTVFTICYVVIAFPSLPKTILNKIPLLKNRAERNCFPL